MQTINYESTKFIKSIEKKNNLPKDKCIEIAFIGYSNVGKSSAINTLSNKKKLALKSKKPGTTKLANLFRLLNNVYLIDFPGYGYSKMSLKKQKKCQNFLNTYLKTRKSLKGIIMLIDIRQNLKKIDKKIIKDFKNKIPIMILLNKSDKLSKTKKIKKINILTSKLKKHKNKIDIETFSSINKEGLTKLKKKINYWLSLNKYLLIDK